ncbi:unnamed protein product [Peniophora sp. CBMAI 1063]|nr:unnamed protein product [Peniophora sp. CBMAI 1063]
MAHPKPHPQPLVFSPSPPSAPSPAGTPAPQQASNTVSMPFVRRHVTRRLKAAKHECDKELQRVTNSISAFFEDRVLPQEDDRGRARGNHEAQEAFNDGGQSTPQDDGSSDGWDAESAHSRHPSTSSPAPIRRAPTISWDSAASSPSTGTCESGSANSPRKNQAVGWSQGGLASRRLSRSLHMPMRPSRSAAPNSRSTSRSRSPLPLTTANATQHSSFSDASAKSTRRQSRVMDELDPIMLNLYELIRTATEVIDMSVAQLTAEEHICDAIVARIQKIGKAWDDNPDWHGRSWYVQVLLAVASLSRVVEWWTAEKHFWNFDDDDDEETDESLLFVMKPEQPSPEAKETLPLPQDVHRMSRVSSQGKRSRDGNTHPEPSRASSMKTVEKADTAESAGVLATERLRLQAENAQNRNIVLELELDGDRVIWINYAWFVVVGTDPERMQGRLISTMLAEEDTTVFREATQRLQEDDSHTVEVRFHLRVEPEGTDSPRTPSTPLFQPMEGKGMLMIREDGAQTHTMWVIKPIGAPAPAEPPSPPEMLTDQPSIADPDKTAGEVSQQDNENEEGADIELSAEPPTPLAFARPINMTPILCRICEQNIAQWYFEKHNETCSETHRLEAEIGECNESIGELRTVIRDLGQALERASPGAQAPEYRGLPILSPSSSPGTSSPLQIFKIHKMQKYGVKKLQRRLLEQLEDILQVAAEVAVPALKEEEQKEPIERQRLLSPSSERKISQIRNWTRPSTSDNGLGQLVADAERVMRQKIDTVVRLQNTIRYSEKVRQEWEERVGLALDEEEGSGSSSSSGECSDGEEGEKTTEGEGKEGKESVDGHSSTTSEYAFGAQSSAPSSDPTPNASALPIPIAVPSAQVPVPRALLSTTPPYASMPPPPPPAPPMPAPAPPLAYQRSAMTRSSTPSSVSSPLALAAPIVARDDDEDDVPFMLDAGSSPGVPLPPPMALSSSIASLALGSMPPPPPPPHLPPPPHPHAPSVSPQIASTPSSQHSSPSIPSAPAPVMRSVRSRRSGNSLAPTTSGTPPLSPLSSPLDLPTPGSTTSRRAHRRHSTINPVMSTAGLPPGSATGAPLSPRAPVNPRSTPTTIKDFEIIKPISKGAFGSVFLARKKNTGDYFAIKVLRKADMIAKNQVTNVKAERMILMKQAESPFVAKLFFTFQSRDNLYLVMEYLNGGDCAALVKTIGSLPEEWARRYVAETVLALEHLHAKGIMHRDMKPDNLLVDNMGHIKLTDFGLSKIGLLGRQTRAEPTGAALSLSGDRSRARTRYSPHSRPPSMDSAYLSSPLIPAELIGGAASERGDDPAEGSGPASGSGSGSGAEPFFAPRRPGTVATDSPLQSFASELTSDLRSHVAPGGGTPPGEHKFVGTPDYLAPETILGLSGDDSTVDWWALGVITYEFLYGAPPFHDETPEKVFENILSGHIDWMEEYVDYDPRARDFMARLMTLDPARRLGAHGAGEVKAHPWFEGIDWDTLYTSNPAFVPKLEGVTDTTYFDARGAQLTLLSDDDVPVPTEDADAGAVAAAAQAVKEPAPAGTPQDDEFGNFAFKNLPVLKQANDEVIRKLRTDQMAPITHTLSDGAAHGHHRKRSTSARKKPPASVVTALDAQGRPIMTNPPSPATSTSSIASSPSRGPGTPALAHAHGHTHSRKPSELGGGGGVAERFKHSHMESDLARRNSMPSRLRTASVSSSLGVSEGSTTGSYDPREMGSIASPPSSVASREPERDRELKEKEREKEHEPNDRAVTVLLAEDNPITAKILETLLIRLGCRCVVVADGAEAVGVALGDIKFDCILMDLHMPVVDGENAARYIKSTNNKNTSTPIVAVSAYSGTDNNEAPSLFAASLAKPVAKSDLLAAMRALGFKTSAPAGKGDKNARVVTGR